MRYFFGVLSFLFFAVPAVGETIDEDQVKAWVLEAIRENPKVIIEAISILEQARLTEEQSAIDENLAIFLPLMTESDDAIILGNPEGDVTIVEFFDYNCPFCRKSAKVLRDRLRDDPGIRVIMREFPSLSEGSIEATRVALAAHKQGEYEAFHWAMLEHKDGANIESALEVAKNIGLDMARLEEDMKDASIESHISQSYEIASELGINGTPAFIVGDRIASGHQREDQLIDLIEAARG